MDYQDAFVDLADTYLEDSWVLDVALVEQEVVFTLDAVMVPEHSRYRPPASGAKYCYRRARLTVASTRPLALRRSGAPAALDASGEFDFGNIDSFTAVERGDEITWELHGEWGDLAAVDPSVDLTFE